MGVDPAISDAFTVDPSKPYSPTVPLPLFTMYMFCALRVAARPHVNAKMIPQIFFAVFI
jgi:hypothetical protein